MTREVLIIVAAAWLAGLTAWVGGLLARRVGAAHTTTRRELVHGVAAFGGGILVAAVAFALLPEGLASLGPVTVALAFCAGGAVFCVVDIQLARAGGSRAQFVAMLTDFVPEALSMGAVFAANPRLGYVLAAFIGLQNLPEGFNSYREIGGGVAGGRRTLRLLFAVSFLGPLCALGGYFLLRDLHAVTAALMSFAAGGILYLTFQDIAPASRMRGHWTPPLGAVLGFVLGMLGKELIG